MSLVFAALVPHPPILIPTVGKEHLKKIEKTKTALQKMEEDLYLSHPDTIIVISPHGKLLPDAFTLNFCNQFESDLREFGDLTTKITFKGEMDLPCAIRESAKQTDLHTIMLTEPKLDHGVSVPLFYLAQHLPDATLLPIGFSNADWKAHLDFGSLLKDEIMNTNKRVAVIASGDLSHALTSDAPAGFNPHGTEFDQALQELLSTRNTTGILQLDPGLVTEAAECGFRSLLILLGILKNINYTYESYAYENPFGVGYLTASFVL